MPGSLDSVNGWEIRAITPSLLYAPDVASAWSRYGPFGMAHSSSMYAPFQLPRTRDTFPASAWAWKGRSRVSLSPVTLSAYTVNPARLRTVASALSLPPEPGSCSTQTGSGRRT
jgi:hypothetical protein